LAALRPAPLLNIVSPKITCRKPNNPIPP
jgi:hypothetical protein